MSAGLSCWVIALSEAMNAAPPAPNGKLSTNATQIDGDQATPRPPSPITNAAPKNQSVVTRCRAAVASDPARLPTEFDANSKPNSVRLPNRWSASFYSDTL